MKTALIGASGFLGSALARSLKNRSLILLSRHSSPPFDLLKVPLAPIDADEIIYAAGSVRNAKDDSSLTALKNALGALKNPSRFIFISSLAVLPPKDGGKLSLYGEKKAAEEKLLWQYKDRHQITVLRPCAVYSDSGGSFEILIRFLKRYRAYPILPSKTIALLPIAGFCSAVQLCLDNPQTIGQSYVALEGYYTWKEAAEYFAKKEGITLEGGKALPHLGILDGLFHEWDENSAPLKALGWKPSP